MVARGRVRWPVSAPLLLAAIWGVLPLRAAPPSSDAPDSGDGLFLAANHDDGLHAFRDLVDAWARHYGVQSPPLF